MGLSRLIGSKLKISFLSFVGILLLLAFNLYYIKPVRNLLLRPVWPRVWYPVDTADILRMRDVKYPPNITDLNFKNCPKVFKPSIRFKDVNQKAVIKYHDANSDNPFFQNEVYANFLPALTWQERLESIHLYLIFADAMKKIGVNFFFIGGSMMGVLRHQGIIPWDTDMDVALNGTQWKEVREHLSCIEGFQLRTNWHMHWKFHYREKHFPFIDLFFFMEDERYIYPMNYYTLSNTLYEKRHVLPIKMALYEGVQVPVPNEYEKCIRLGFDLEYCYPPSTNHKTGKHFKETIVKCSSMSDYYPIMNVNF